MPNKLFYRHVPKLLTLAAYATAPLLLMNKATIADTQLYALVLILYGAVDISNVSGNLESIWAKRNTSMLELVLDRVLHSTVMHSVDCRLLIELLEHSRIEMDYIPYVGRMIIAAISFGEEDGNFDIFELERVLLTVSQRALSIDDESARDINKQLMSYGLLALPGDELRRFLIDNGADITTAMSIAGDDGVFVAAGNGYLDIVKETVTDFKITTLSDITCLPPFSSLVHASACGGDVQTLNYCIERGCDINSVVKIVIPVENTVMSATPLQFACQRGRVEAVLDLLTRGCDVAHGSTFESAPNVEIARILRDHGWVPEQFLGRTPLCSACERGMLDITRYLLTTGSSPSETDWTESTPLHRTSTGAVAMLLIESGASVGSRNNMKQIPLHTAAQLGHIEVVRVLIERGSVVNAKDRDGNTALHFAVHGGHHVVVRLLLDAGADISSLNKKGRTPLDDANGDVMMKKMLAGDRKSCVLM